MAELLKSSIVRIRNMAGEIVGTGFLVGERHIVTCAHVVRDALGLEATPVDLPQVELQLDFPFSGVEQPLKARVVCWHPHESGGGGDVAGLILNGYPPPMARPVNLITSDDLWDHAFRAFGFPLGRDDGVWTTGLIRDIQATGWVQVNVVTETGYAVAPGFSGGPVWDGELTGVVGMTVAADMAPNARAAYMISAETLIQTWPDLGPQPDEYERIDLPIVVVAMTHTEARKLFIDPAFTKDKMSKDEATKFEKFKEAFTQGNIPDWLSHYADKRRYWRPHTYADSTIYEIVLDMIHEVNDWLGEEPKPQLIRPRFLSDKFFAEDQNMRNETWDELTESGGIVIVDSVSLFHPGLRQMFIQSHIGAHPKTAVLVLPPVSTSAILANQLIETEIHSWMQRAFDRFAQFDRLCEFGVGNLRSLERWLFRAIPEMATSVQTYKSTPANRRKFRRKMNMRPSGFGVLIARGGIRR